MSELSEKEMVPPWEEFPTYELYSMGWRMGSGENYNDEWIDFLQKLPDDYDTRTSYLSRHRPAPINWADLVLCVLYPEKKWDKNSDSYEAEKLRLLEQGLIAHDAAYHTWLGQQSEITWPWTLICGDTPEDSARNEPREFWFFSRQYSAIKSGINLNTINIPPNWESVKSQLLTGILGKIDPAKGLLTLAQMLCVGEVQPPWLLGLQPNDLISSSKMDMGYTDAFRLWIMYAFDDDLLLSQMVSETRVPADWLTWIDENITIQGL